MQMFFKQENLNARPEPVICLILVFICGVVFYGELGMGVDMLRSFFLSYGIEPVRDFIFRGEQFGFSFRYISYMFVHAGWGQFLVNMWILWTLGDFVEKHFKSIQFLIFYLLCGILAAICHTLTNPNSTGVFIGSSGANAGLIGAFIILGRNIPLSKISVVSAFIPGLGKISAWIFIVLISIVAHLVEFNTPTFIAHCAGFIVGLSFCYLFFQFSKPNSLV